MPKRTGKKRGRPPKNDIGLLLVIENRPQGQSIKRFCEDNAEWLIQWAGLDSDVEDPAGSIMRRYYRVAHEYTNSDRWKSDGTVQIIDWWHRKGRPKKKR